MNIAVFLLGFTVFLMDLPVFVMHFPVFEVCFPVFLMGCLKYILFSDTWGRSWDSKPLIFGLPTELYDSLTVIDASLYLNSKEY